jgi:hypothetical protein
MNDTNGGVWDSVGLGSYSGNTAGVRQGDPGGIVEDTGTSMFFDGNDASPAYAQLVNGVQFDSGDFTIEFWYRGYTVGPVQTIWMSGTSGGRPWVHVTLQADGIVYFDVADMTNQVWLSGGWIPTNSWRHVALVRQGNTFRIYDDGTLVGSQTVAIGDVDEPGAGTRFGRHIAGYGNLRTTWLDEIAAYKKALTAAEIKWHADRGKNCFMEDIAGASGTFTGSTTSYTLGAADVGKKLRLKVTASNANGSTSAYSTGTALVQAAPTLESPLTNATVKTFTPVLRAN